MIIDKRMVVKITKRNIQHYIQFYPEIRLKDIIEVDTEIELMKGSNSKVTVKCDLCDTTRYITFQAYNNNINSCIEYQIYTCDKCSHLKIKEYNKKKYGVEYYSQTKEYTDKFKSTMIDRYGVEYALQSDKLLKKQKDNNIDKYGVENVFQVDEIKNEIKKNNLEKYGFEFIQSTSEVRRRIKNTMLERYGVENPLQNGLLREIGRKTMLNLYGNKYASKSESFRINTIIGGDKDYIKYISDNVSIFNCTNEHVFYIDSSLYHNRKRSGVTLCTVCNPINSNSSIKEDDIFNYIELNYKGKLIRRYRDEIEIDIYLPDLKIGFEFNGLYWHSEEYKDKNYHSHKTSFFKEKDIRIIHIWEDDWDNKKDIVKSMILNLLNKSPNKIYARNCKIKDDSPVIELMNHSHLQGSDKSKIKIGLYYDDKLVSAMTFNRMEGRKKLSEGEWNLSRFCTVLNTNVIGGASKLLKYFISKYNPTRIISYADKDWSNGQLYHNLGFNKIYETSPDYKYVIDGVRKHKQNFQKSNLKLSTNETESDFMKKNGVYKIWDCGKIKFEYKND